MLEITIPELETYDDEKEEFSSLPEIVVQLEHSLVSVSKWESKWKLPFMSREEKTREQTLDYIRCMAVDDVPLDRLLYLDAENYKKIQEYIQDSMTATTIRENGRSHASREVITSEVIYYWMISQNVPFECQHWHFNRLITLLKVSAAKNSPPKKRTAQEVAEENRALNAARRAKYGTKG